jgi:hypothetical protein
VRICGFEPAHGLLHWVFWVRANGWGPHLLTPWHSRKGRSKVPSPTFQWLKGLVHPKNHLWSVLVDLPSYYGTLTPDLGVDYVDRDLSHSEHDWGPWKIRPPWNLVLQASLTRKITTWGRKFDTWPCDLNSDIEYSSPCENFWRLASVPKGPMTLFQKIGQKFQLQTWRRRNCANIPCYSEFHVTQLSKNIGYYQSVLLALLGS